MSLLSGQDLFMRCGGGGTCACVGERPLSREEGNDRPVALFRAALRMPPCVLPLNSECKRVCA
jgi:hypothetical protein